MLKRVLSLVLVLAMLAGYMMPMQVYAEEIENTEAAVAEETIAAPEETVLPEVTAAESAEEPTAGPAEETTAPTQSTVPEETSAPTEEAEEALQFAECVYTSEEDFTSEELFEAYAANLFFGNSFSFFGTAAGETLTGDEKVLYDALVPMIKQIACGQRASASVSIGQAVDGYTVDAEAVFSGAQFTSDQLSRVVDALLADLPFEFYWYEKTSGCLTSAIRGEKLLQLILKFTVADNYSAGDDYTADTSRTGAATRSAAKAQDIVDTYASASDYEKLVGYRDAICGLVEYDYHAAMGGYFSTDIDPWQLISVFDGDTTTNVVCEGYSKAFQYLCDLSSFSGDVTCYMVSGLMDGGAHMWNIVSIEGSNYLTDITNSDAGTVGYDGSLFLAGAAGSVPTGYTASGVHYVYFDDALALWGAGADSILILSSEKYTPPTGGGEVEDENLIASGTCGENLTWKLDKEGTLTISGTGAIGNYYFDTIPWYDYHEQIKAVVIKEGATSIGNHAFDQCTALQSVEIPSTVTEMGFGVFNMCDSLEKLYITDLAAWLRMSDPYGARPMMNRPDGKMYLNGELVTDLALPDGITTIRDYAFHNCSNLQSITIPDTVTSIGSAAFFGCSSLKEIRLPEGVTEIGDNAFYDCTGLQSITIPDSVNKINASAFYGCSSLTSISIPDSITSIEGGVFFGCSSLTSVHIPDSVTSIGSNAFGRCSSLTSIDIPDGVTDIGSEAFWECQKLVSIQLPAGLTQLGASAFSGCRGLTGINIPDGITCISSRLFDCCRNLTEITIPSGVTAIEDEAFFRCEHLTSITIPERVTSIGSNAFVGCSRLKNITFEGDVPDIAADACGSGMDAPVRATVYYPIGNPTWTADVMQNYGGTLTWVSYVPKVPITGTCGENLTWELKDGTLTISGTGPMQNGENALISDRKALPWYDYRELIKAVVIKEGVTTIGDYAFEDCVNLPSITLPDSITSIGQDAFWKCRNLESITFGKSVFVNTGGAFYECDSLKDVYIFDPSAWCNSKIDIFSHPLQYGASLHILDENGNEVTAVVLDDSVKEIPHRAFQNSKLKSIVIPDGVTDIGEHAFENCIGLTAIEIPNGVVSIGNDAFRNCSNLKSIVIPESVTSMGWGVFGGCSYLTSATIGNGVTSIGTYAFGGCSRLASITIGNSVTSIGDTAFDNCRALTSIVLPHSVTSIGRSAFEACSNLTSITLGSGLTEIGERAFCQCQKLRDVVIPDSVVSIGDGAFAECKALTSIVIPSGVTSIGTQAFLKCSGLTSIELSDGLTSIGLNAFSSCSNLASITIPASVIRINGGAFTKCTRLKEITFEGDAPNISTEVNEDGLGVFSGVTATAYYPVGNPTWTADKLQNYGGRIKWVAKCTNHDVVILESVFPTCTETGLTEGSYCAKCNEVLVAQQTVPALGHDFDTVVTNPTCTADGEKWSQCKLCPHVETEVLPAFGHAEVIDKGFAPTCTETGLTEGKHCDRCGEVYVPQEVIPATGHSYEEQDGKQICAVCDKEIYVQILHDSIHLDLNFLTGMQLEFAVSDYLAEKVKWSIEGEAVLEVDQNGFVTAVGEGTAYVVATVEEDGVELISTCCVDVTERLQLDGIQLNTTAVTTELYKTDYANFEVLLQLPQNYPVEGDGYDQRGGSINVPITSARFTSDAVNDLFKIEVGEDRTLRIVPDYDNAVKASLTNSKAVSSKYTDTVTVTVEGTDYTSTEKLTLTVKKTMPKLKATIAAFNSFYAGQSQEIVITGGDITGIRVNEDVATPIPAWLTLENGSLKLNGETPKSSDKAYIWVDVDGWSAPVAMTLSVKHAYKAPTLKLSASSVTLNTLNGDKKTISVTSSFADYIPDDLEISSNAGDALTLEKQGSGFTVSTNDQTVSNKTYKITVQTANPKIKAVTLTVKTVGKNPTMNSLKVKGTMDVTFPVNQATIGVTLKDYADIFVPKLTIKDSKGNDVTNQFSSNWNGTEFAITPSGAVKGTYTATVSVNIDMGEDREDITLTKTVKLTVKETLPKVKLSATKVTLNKKLNHSTVVEITSATKGYELEHHRVEITAPEQIKAVYADGKLQVSLHESAAYGKTYKVTIRAYEGASAVTLSIAVPAEKKSNVTATIKASGSIDVIRESTAITVTPTFTNAYASDMESMELRFYKKDGKVWADVTEDAPFHVELADGKYIVTAKDGLVHTDKYQAELVVKVGDEEITSKRINLSLKMGSTKLTTKTSDTTLFAKDRNDRALVWFEAADATLNEVSSITFKNAKQAELFEIIDYGGGLYAIGFKDGKVDKSLLATGKATSKTVTVSLNVFLDGNETIDPGVSKTAKANAAVNVKLIIVK